mgnify:CR=1 FL=1
MNATGIRGEGDIVFCANVCEEGLGDLRGIKHVLRIWQTQKGATTVSFPLMIKNLWNHLPGSRQRALSGNFPRNRRTQLHRLRNSQPDSRNGKGDCENQRFPDTKESENYFSVGVVNGGTSVNVIAAECSMLVDLRSVDAGELEKLSAKLHQAIEEAVNEENAAGDMEL